MNKESNPKKGAGHKAGGPTSMDRKKFGRNMSRAMNQRGGKRGS